MNASVRRRSSRRTKMWPSKNKSHCSLGRKAKKKVVESYYYSRGGKFKKEIFGLKVSRNGSDSRKAWPRFKLLHIPTDPFGTLELQNPSLDVHELHKSRQSPDCQALKLWNSGRDTPPACTAMYVGPCPQHMQFYLIKRSSSLVLRSKYMRMAVEVVVVGNSIQAGHPGQYVSSSGFAQT